MKWLESNLVEKQYTDFVFMSVDAIDHSKHFYEGMSIKEITTIDNALNDFREFSDIAINLLFNSQDWLENSEWDSIRVRGLIIFSIAKYLKIFNINLNEWEHKKRLNKELDILINDIKKYKNSPIVLDGLKGLIAVVAVAGISNTMKETLFDIIENGINLLRDVDLWDKETGSWGYENTRTCYKVKLIFEYWEMHFENTTLKI